MNQLSQPSVRRNGSIKLGNVVILSLVILIGGAVIYWAFFQRERQNWSEVVKLWNGRTLPIQQQSSERACHFAAGHGYLWGGGDPWHKTTFLWMGKSYCWEGPYIPIVIQPDRDDVIYVVAFDRETPNYRPTYFRLYQSVTCSSWKEIATNEYPKHLAIQNTWLHQDAGDIVAKMDPSSFWFRESLTAKLWSYLEHPHEFDFAETPSEDFVQRFKERWIRIPDATGVSPLR
jgi:hypothetical protein